MAKRLVRIPHNQIEAKIATLLDAEVSLVMHDNTVAFGKIAGINASDLKLETVKGKFLAFNFKDILEIVYDKPASQLK